MTNSSRNVALLLASSISIITTSFLSLIEGVTLVAFLVVFLISFGSSYLLLFITLEYFIFGEINKLYDVLNKLREGDEAFNQSFTKPKTKLFFSKINEEIFSYVAVKQDEIDQLKKAETYRREFIADVSHELKTPIFAAQGFVHTLLDGAVKDKSVRIKFLKKAAKSLDGLDRLVQDLLTISEIETGTTKMEMVNFSLSDLITEIFEQLEDKAEKKEVDLFYTNNTSDPRGMVVGDRQRIYQVLLNLITNSMKYKKEGIGRVDVILKEEGNFIWVEEKDNGIGIEKAHLNRIFERFYRVDKSRSRERGGTGLGLSIVKHILESHHSMMQVDSTPGVGTTFRFRLKKGHTKPLSNPSAPAVNPSR